MAKIHNVASTKKFIGRFSGILSRFQVPGMMEQRRFYAPEPVRRFYKNVEMKEGEDGFRISLDHRTLRTPTGKMFTTNNETLAHALVAEWAGQGKIVERSTMHLTALQNTVLDNPTRKSKLNLVNEVLSQLAIDTIIYRTQEDMDLWDLQTAKWDPLVFWFQEEFGVKLPIVSGSILPPEIPDDTLSAVRRYILKHSYEAVQGLSFSVSTLRSVILPLAIARQRLSVEEAVSLARLEVGYQTSNWGTVEWSHDVEQHDSVARVAAGMFFFELHTNVPFLKVTSPKTGNESDT